MASYNKVVRTVGDVPSPRKMFRSLEFCHICNFIGGLLKAMKPLLSK